VPRCLYSVEVEYTYTATSRFEVEADDVEEAYDKALAEADRNMHYDIHDLYPEKTEVIGYDFLGEVGEVVE
jgi:hypothetical protein